MAPAHLVMLTRSDLLNSYDISSLEHVVTGGACLPDAVKQEVLHKLKLRNLRQGECLVFEIYCSYSFSIEIMTCESNLILLLTVILRSAC